MNSTEMIQIRMPKEMKDGVSKLAKESGMTISGYIKHLLLKQLQQETL